METKDIHLVYGTDDNYVFPTAVSAASAAFLDPDKNDFTLDPLDENAIAEALCRAMALPDDALRAMGRESHSFLD